MKYISYIIPLLLAAPALARPDGVGGHHGDHGAHHADHGAAAAPAPASSYQEPAYTPEAQYAAPSTGYEQPSYSTGYEPDTGYSATGTGYAADASGYGSAPAADAGFDLSNLLIPILIIAGLALLFPSVQFVDVSRKKRDVGDEPQTVNSVQQRVLDILGALGESEECMERIACEVGGLAESAGVDKTMTKLAGDFVPKKYSKMMKTFNFSKDCHKIKCGNLF